MKILNPKDLTESSELLRALAHPLRLTIMSFIDEHGVINVNKIYNTLKIEQSITSQHLRILRKVDLVHTKRDGKFIHYSLNYDKIKEAKQVLDHFVPKTDA